MVISFVRRGIGSWLAVSLSVMALSACTSGPMTMSEMVCCAGHHDECEMAGQAQSCCAPDLQSDMGVRAAERTDTTHATDAASRLAVLPTPQTGHLLTLAAAFVETCSLLSVRSQPDPLSTVLLI